MQFRWDSNKDRINRRKHGVSFDEATTVFGDPLAMTISDPDHSIGEERFATLGRTVAGQLVVVTYSDDGDIVRIISAREASTHERKRYESWHFERCHSIGSSYTPQLMRLLACSGERFNAGLMGSSADAESSVTYYSRPAARCCRCTAPMAPRRNR